MLQWGLSLTILIFILIIIAPQPIQVTIWNLVFVLGPFQGTSWLMTHHWQWKGNTVWMFIMMTRVCPLAINVFWSVITSRSLHYARLQPTQNPLRGDFLQTHLHCIAQSASPPAQSGVESLNHLVRLLLHFQISSGSGWPEDTNVITIALLCPPPNHHKWSIMKEKSPKSLASWPSAHWGFQRSPHGRLDFSPCTTSHFLRLIIILVWGHRW